MILSKSQIFLNQLKNKYDHVFPPNSQQSDIYNFVSEAVEGILKGLNSTIFAYGQTGSGKTYTMFGKDWESKIKKVAHETLEWLKKGEEYNGDESDLYDLGLIPRTIQEVFYYIANNAIGTILIFRS